MAGSAICRAAKLDEDQVVFFRNDEETLLDIMDPIQVFIPAPIVTGLTDKAKPLEHLTSDK